MNIKEKYDIVIIGGGIVGIATAYQLSTLKKYNILLIESENELAKHQTGHNSGVIHSGLYYKPGSLKAENCRVGREMMYQFCNDNSIKHEKCGKVVIAVNSDELKQLEILIEKGKGNGLKNLRILSRTEILEHEKYANCVGGIFVEETGIVDFKSVVKRMSELAAQNNVEILTNTKFISGKEFRNELIVTTNNFEVNTKLIVNCGGLHSDRIAKACGIEPNIQIIPFRGEYYVLKKEKEYLVKNLIYPVPDPQFPFLGVHFTRMIDGGIEAGPNAVLAFKREGYTKKDISLNDLFEMLYYPGFRKMVGKYWRMGIEEMKRSFSKKLFVNSLQKLIPELNYDDVTPFRTGVRAQAVDRNGKLLDDFVIQENKNMIHVLNAPSPAATASLSIGKKIAELAISKFD